VTREEVRQQIVDVGIVPIVRAHSKQTALAAAEAVYAGGISVIEITTTVPEAYDVIRELVQNKRDDLLVGAGTVLDPGMARECVEAGAQFLISPGFDLATVEFALREKILIIAGALTPTEILTAWKAGADLIKVFPCSALGGAGYIKALRAPLPQIPLVPTGGVNLSNTADFFRAGAVAVGIGGELVSSSALRTGNLAEITELAKKYRAVVQQARLEQAPATVVAS
jgi:2-dehydro-3-deoxyphosphogluconate aldolase / (4S)-4-hydroxy-2-oxoglutarate aldolase